MRSISTKHALSHRFSMMDNFEHCGKNTFLDRLFLTQFYTHGLNHSGLAVLSVQQWKAFIFKSPRASYLMVHVQNNETCCPNMGMGENRSDLPQTLAEHKQVLQVCSTMPT